MSITSDNAYLMYTFKLRAPFSNTHKKENDLD